MKNLTGLAQRNWKLISKKGNVDKLRDFLHENLNRFSSKKLEVDRRNEQCCHFAANFQG
jgi:hypothetical protein